MPTINIIVALARNRAIGQDNHLLYSLPDDMRHFRQLTTGHTIIMGRRTFQSLPKGALPNRRNIILTRSKKQFDSAESYHSLQEALTHCAESEQVFIIGGASVYQEALPLAHKLYITEIEDTPRQADTFFPSYDNWKEIARQHHTKDERHDVAFDFVEYINPQTKH